MEDLDAYALAAVGTAEGLFNNYIKPEITAKRTWALIGAVVVAHEYFCPDGQLLSEGADRAIEKHPVLVPLAGLVLAGHVLNIFSERYDIVHKAFVAFRGE
jgi:hypothetical protein